LLFSDTKIRSRTILLCLACLLASCGFHLRGTQNSAAANFNTIHISASGEMFSLLRRGFQRSNKEVTTTASAAEYSLVVSGVRNSRRAVATTSNISVAEYELVQVVDARLLSHDREEVIPTFRVATERSYSFDNESLESSSEEEALLREEMRRDLSEQILRRVNISITNYQNSREDISR
jgi:LPS-assembly lipoprotein